MKKTGVAIALIGAIQLFLSSLLLFLVAETSGASFSTYWAASGWTIWYPQYVAGITLIIVGLVVFAINRNEARGTNI